MEREYITSTELRAKGYEHRETIGDGREVFVGPEGKGIYNPHTNTFVEVDIHNK